MNVDQLEQLIHGADIVLYGVDDDDNEHLILELFYLRVRVTNTSEGVLTEMAETPNSKFLVVGDLDEGDWEKLVLAYQARLTDKYNKVVKALGVS